ncbi:hypothetical protein PENTCL1PPCAC_17240 [Pristionchus entomophagus]|uniref:Nuclear receptor n=1 Tax=Pristionchus entomophagus TaxID=358040 RepID=A0AAV5TL18_9BILA|nr:hypothetical protein PENTCL1PPCAC_17240 [Pristionchus entomophagus]
MVRPRESREKRLCLACGSFTRVSHLGLDLCRACAVFHRRSLTREYVCRSRTDNCSTGIGQCRKCRFMKIDGMLENASPIDIVYETEETGEKEIIPLLSRMTDCYRVMCETRLIGELSSRSSSSHPMQMNDRDFIPTPATPSALNEANRIFLAAILNFGHRAFPEFNDFEEAERWKIVSNFFHRFRLFEAGFRADKKFPDDFNKSFGSYTMFVSVEVAQSFYEDAQSNRMMAESLRKDLGPNRERFRRLKLHDEEFISVLILMFWNSFRSSRAQQFLQV